MKSDKFRHLAERRVNNAIKQLRLIGNLANSNAYEYTDDQTKKIFAALNGEIDRIQSKFKTASSGVQEGSFSL